MAEKLYHIVPADELRAALEGERYRPPSLEREGFVHCALRASVLSVADDYYAGERRELVLLEIDPERLASELRYEAPAPRPGGGRAHLAAASEFPHVYGPIQTEAICAVGLLEAGASGFEWPRVFLGLEAYLARPKARSPATAGR
jgi:uncharacterized protein (DUF952 family)